MRTAKWMAAAALVLSAGALALVGDPSLEDEMAWRHDQLEETLVSRAVHVDPAELLGLMHDDLVKLRIVDVRGEADYNLFHLADAERVDCEELFAGWGEDLAHDVIVVVVGNDELRAEGAWRMLRARGLRNLYVLAGGLNRWVEIYAHTTPPPAAAHASVAAAAAANLIPTDTSECLSDEPFAWSLPAALGDRHPVSFPDPDRAPPREFEPKVQRVTKAPRPGGGCG